MRRFITALIMVVSNLLPYVMHGQEHVLKAGDAFPDITFRNVQNYSKSELKFSALRPKLVVLDFWSITCSACIYGFPKIDSIQKRFGDRVQMVMVTKESKAKVDSFLARRPQIKLPDVIQIMSDTLLHKAFPSVTVSLSVWIDSVGKIAFTTENFEANAVQLKKYLNGESVDLVAFRGKAKYRKSLFDEHFDNDLMHFSYLARYNGINVGYGFDEGVHLEAAGYSAVELFVFAFDEHYKKGFRRPNRLILDLQDSFKYVRPKPDSGRYGEWKRKYSYCYQLFLPENKKGEEYKLMQQDLLRYFDLDVSIEKREVPALKLVRSGTKDLLRTKGGKPESDLRQNEIFLPVLGGTRSIINKPFNRLYNVINGIFENSFGLPVIDSTNYEGAIDITLSGDALDRINNNFESADVLREELRQYGLELIPAKTKIEVLIIKELVSKKR